jgi:hypothetical protein
MAERPLTRPSHSMDSSPDRIPAARSRSVIAGSDFTNGWRNLVSRRGPVIGIENLRPQRPPTEEAR